MSKKSEKYTKGDNLIQIGFIVFEHKRCCLRHDCSKIIQIFFLTRLALFWSHAKWWRDNDAFLIALFDVYLKGPMESNFENSEKTDFEKTDDLEND